MAQFSKQVKEYIEFSMELMRKMFHFGFVPFVVYMGWKFGPDVGCPPFHLTHLLWHY